MQKIYITLVALLFSFISLADDGEVKVNASDNTKNTIAKYFSEGEDGWFWYNELPPEIQEKIMQAIEKAALAGRQEDKKDVPLSPAWFRKNFQAYSDKAIQNPNDKEAMRTYLYLEKYMRDRSEKFAYIRQAAIYSDPYLDETTRSPTSTMANRVSLQHGFKIKTSILKELSNNFGLYFFYRSDCAYCHKQAPILKMLAVKYGFTIIPVSLDGLPLPDGHFDDYKVDSGQARALGVSIVPSLVAYDVENQVPMTITQGLYVGEEIEQRILIAAKESGYINDLEMTRMRGVGLYPGADGELKPLTDIPDNAPKEFVDLYNEHLKGGKKNEK